MSSSGKDRIYACKQEKVDNFAFDDHVADVFSDMIQRSVPGYTALNQLLPLVAKQFIQPDSNIYDLGCSLGEASISINNTLEQKNINIFAVDSSSAMIKKLLHKLESLNLDKLIQPIHEDITKIDIKNSSFVILNYTLQFIERSKRDDLSFAFVRENYLSRCK